MLILPFRKLAMKRDTFVCPKHGVSNPKIIIHSSQVDQFVCTPYVTQNEKETIQKSIVQQ